MLAGFADDGAPRAVFSSFLLVQLSVETPQLQFICVVVDLPVVAHMPSLMVQTARRTIEIPQLLVYRVVNVPVLRDVQVPRVRRGEDSCSLSCSSLRKAALSSGGGSFSPDDASDSALDSVMPMKGKYTILFFQSQAFGALRCRVVVKVSLLMVLTSMHGTA